MLAVRERLLRATGALEAAGIPYAVIGGNAVAVWVADKDPSAVRNTQDVDLMVRREDMPAVTHALESVGFRYRRAVGVHMFLDGPKARARDAVHVLFAGEKVRVDYECPAPSMDEVEVREPFRLLALEALVRMKLTSNRDKDRTHVRDLIDVGSIDESWLTRFSPVLAERLRSIIETPEG